MQAQDAATAYFLKSWSWVEANIKFVAIGAGIVAVAAAVAWYYFWHQDQMKTTAGEALTQLFISPPHGSDAGQLANAYLKIATDYPGTPAGGRALVVGATALFENGQYPEARAQFQKYLHAYAGGTFAATAALGAAASLEAEGKTEAAAAAYQRVINSYSDLNAVDQAKFALAKIDEQQGNVMAAESFYQDVALDNPNNPLGADAAFHAHQLRNKLSLPTARTNSLSAPFSLGTNP